jgi:hypothetical protein
VDCTLHIIHFSIMINDTPSGFFNSSRGLRHPLSPILFVIVMEALSPMMAAAGNGGFIFSFWWGLGVMISYKYPISFLLRVPSFSMGLLHTSFNT